MYKQYLKQAMALLKESPFFSLITVLGTAAAICMIMVMVIIFEIQNKGFEPEVNRDRTLYVKQMAIKKKENEGAVNYSLVSGPVAKACLLSLKIPEAVSMQLFRAQTLVTTTDRTHRMKCDQLRTDAAFWTIFSFRYMAGKPFLRSDVESSRLQAVISHELALRMFGAADEQVVGQSLLVARRLYTVCGIVEDVSPLANHAYAQIWTPYPQSDIDQLVNEESLKGLSGSYCVLIKANSASDFDAIKKEVDQKVKAYNQTLTSRQIDFVGQPDTQMENRLRLWSNVGPDMSKMLWQYVLILSVLLLIPAMNLSGLTTSRMQRRIGELGVRKAFGATRGTLVRQVLMENFFVTLLGGAVGLLFSYMTVYWLKDWLLGSYELSGLNSSLSLSAGMLIRPTVFLGALLFCLILNLLSAAIPAWNATRGNIVDSLNEP